MNLVKSIDKIKSALEQLKDAADKTEVKYPEGTPKSVLELQKKNITKAAEISEAILDEAQELALYYNAKNGVEITPIDNAAEVIEKLQLQVLDLITENDELKEKLAGMSDEPQAKVTPSSEG